MKVADPSAAARLRNRAAELEGEMDRKFKDAQRQVDEKLSREAELLQTVMS